jgi:uncharacterized RDD family membrane protein YckC
LEAAQADQAREAASKRPNDSAISRARAQEAQVRNAWQVLSDPYQRGRYDATLELGGHTNGHADADSGLAVDDAEVGEDGRTDEEFETFQDDATPPWRKKQRERQKLAAAARGPVLTDDGTPLELATPGRRAMAAVIDTVIALIGWGAAAAIAYSSDFSTATQSGIALGVMFGIFIAYLLVPTILRGQTLGKKLTHVMLVDRATGHLPTSNKVLLHYFPVLIPAVLFSPQGGGPISVLAGLSFLMNRDGMSWGDKFAKTAVVIARYRPVRVRPERYR